MKQDLISAINNISTTYSTKNPWTQVYGMARSILALGTFLTLLLNNSSILFPDLLSFKGDSSILLRKFNLFILFGVNNLKLAVWFSIAILFLIIIGWRPKVTCILHWWITSSFIQVSGIIDGGDQIASIISFFLIPIGLTDNRKWHWNRENKENQNPYITLFIWSVIFIIRLQVAFIYFNAGVEKLKIEEWKDGTSAYYWFTNEIYGANDIMHNVVLFFTSQPLIVTLLTYGTLIIEIILGMALFMHRNNLNWKILFLIGVFFHIGIVFIFGLVTFFMTMTAALILYLVPLNYIYKRKPNNPELFELK